MSLRSRLISYREAANASSMRLMLLTRPGVGQSSRECEVVRCRRLKQARPQGQGMVGSVAWKYEMRWQCHMRRDTGTAHSAIFNPRNVALGRGQAMNIVKVSSECTRNR